MYPSNLSSRCFASLCLLLATALLPCFPAGAQARIEMALDSTTIQVGSTVSLRLQVRTPDGTPPSHMDFSAWDTLSGLEVLDLGPFRQSDLADVRYGEQIVRLIAFEVGEQRIPPVAVYWGDTFVLSEPLLLTVLLPKLLPDATLAPIKDIIEEKKRLTDRRWPWVLGCLMLAGTAWWLWQKRRHKPKTNTAIPPVETPAHEIARQQLEALQIKQLWCRAPKHHYTELTDILRTYISLRFFIPALSETSTGILDDLMESRLNTVALERLERILHTADLVKFAKAEPSDALSEQLLEDALLFVEETRPLEPLKTIAS